MCCVSVLFSEPKIPQSYARVRIGARSKRGFSALQRAEKSSIAPRARAGQAARGWFQCSSASRKFLNSYAVSTSTASPSRFSALQRAENSSNAAHHSNLCFHTPVSVLFSEPKIPQSREIAAMLQPHFSFSALQRAENSSIPTLAPASIHISDRDDHASSFLSLPGASP